MKGQQATFDKNLPGVQARRAVFFIYELDTNCDRSLSDRPKTT